MKVTTKVKTLKKLAKEAGIEIVVAGGKGSHEKWFKAGCKPFVFAAGGSSECSVGVAKKAMAYIEGDLHKAFNGKAWCLKPHYPLIAVIRIR